MSKAQLAALRYQAGDAQDGVPAGDLSLAAGAATRALGLARSTCASAAGHGLGRPSDSDDNVVLTERRALGGELRTIARHAGTSSSPAGREGIRVTDTIGAGRYSQQALAALSVGLRHLHQHLRWLMGVLQALLPTWAELHGAGRRTEVGRSVRQALYLSGLTMVVGVTALYFPGPLLEWTQVPPALQAEVREYLAVLTLALPAALLFRMYSTLNQSLGKPLLVTWLQIGSMVVKVPLSIWFAFGGLGLDARGAVGCAWATVVVNWLFILLALWLVRTQPLYQPYAIWRPLERPDWPVIRQFARIGIPGGLAIMVEVTSFTLMALFIARQGTLASAAHQIASNVAAVMFMTPLSAPLPPAPGQLLAGRCRPAPRPGHDPPGFRLALVLALCLAAATMLGRHAIAAFYSGRPRWPRSPPACWPGWPSSTWATRPGDVRVRAALLPGRGGAAGGLLRAARGCRTGRGYCWRTTASARCRHNFAARFLAGQRLSLALLALILVAILCELSLGTTAAPRSAQPRRRKHDREGGTRARRAFDLQLGPVPLRHVLDDRQPQAGAAGLTRTAAVDSIEALGQARQVLRRDAGSGVADREHGAAVRQRLPADVDRAARAGVAHRIAHQVGQRAEQFALGTCQFDPGRSRKAQLLLLAQRGAERLRLLLAVGTEPRPVSTRRPGAAGCLPAATASASSTSVCIRCDCCAISAR